MHVLKHMHVHTYTNYYTKVNVLIFMSSFCFQRNASARNPSTLFNVVFNRILKGGVVIPLIFSQSFLGILRVPQSPPLFQELEERFVLLCTRFQARRMIAENQWVNKDESSHHKIQVFHVKQKRWFAERRVLVVQAFHVLGCWKLSKKALWRILLFFGIHSWWFKSECSP